MLGYSRNLRNASGLLKFRYVEVRIRPGTPLSRRSARMPAKTCMPLAVMKATENEKLVQSASSALRVDSTLALPWSSLPRMRGE